MFTRFIFTLLLLVLCNGCRFGPDYHLPPLEVPEEWKTEIECPEQPQEKASCGQASFEVWWNVFNDDVLNWLETEALLNNPNLAAALDRIAEARAMAGVDKAALYPQVNLQPVWNDTGQLIKIYVPKGLFPNTGAINTDLQRPFRVHEELYTMPLNMSYEIDLWGKLQGTYESALLDAESQTENYLTTLLTLTADVASNYFQLRALDTRIDLLEYNLNVLQDNLSLVRSRYQKGLVNNLDVYTAEQQLADLESSYYDIVRQRVLQENIIAALIGRPASNFCLEPMPLQDQPPCIPSGLPSEILLRRPDIAAAEREMASKHALIGVAYASFLPSLQLTSTLGFSSPTFKDFLTWFSRWWAFGANIGQMIFDGGRNQANLNLAYANFREFTHQYLQTVLTAFREVEDALANIEYQSKQYYSYKKSSVSGQKRAGLSLNRYKQGLGNYLDVLDSERTVISSELNEVNALALQYVATVQLIKALGGAWTVLPPTECHRLAEEASDF